MSTTFRGRFVIDGRGQPANTRRWDPEAYEQAVLRSLEEIELTWVGRTVLGQITCMVLIRPIDDFLESNAYASPPDAYTSTAAGEPLHHPDGAIVRDSNGDVVRGEGGGVSSIYVAFTPGQWPREGSMSRASGGMAPLTDTAVLVHELVHGVHHVLGVYRGSAMYRFHTVDEYRAVTVTNMYYSERGMPLRANYLDIAYTETGPHGNERWGYRTAQLEPSAGDPTGRAELEAEQIARYQRDAPALAWTLAAIPESVCDYNPFRAHERGTFQEIPAADPWCGPQCDRA